jgi:FMN reductase
MDGPPPRRPLILGIGGAGPASSSEQALRIALAAAEEMGAETRLVGGEALAGLPLYLAPGCREHPRAQALIAGVRQADGFVLSSPGYHGTVSGLFKNAIDYIEETARDERAYFHDRPVGLIALASGWQAANTTLATLRTIAHALRGWPTPFGAAIRTRPGLFLDGNCTDPDIAEQLHRIAAQAMRSLGHYIRRDAEDILSPLGLRRPAR